MQHRSAVPPDPEVFPVDPWRLIESGFRPELLPLTETLFALANGHLGIRGSLEETEPGHERGTYVNGFYETWPINYPEQTFGLPEMGQSIVTLPDATALVLHVDGEPMRLTQGRVFAHERVLDMGAGRLIREVDWESPGGTRIRLRSERLVSFVRRHLAAFRVEIELVAGGGPLTLVSGLADPHAPSRPGRTGEADDPRGPRDMEDALVLETTERMGRRAVSTYRTRRSGLRMGCAIDHHVGPSGDVVVEGGDDGDTPRFSFTVDGEPGTLLRVEKYAAYHAAEAESETDPAELAGRDLDRAVAAGFSALCAEQAAYMREFWERADVQIDGDDRIQQAVRWNLFQVAQAALRTDGQGVPAKGLTGRGYDGHYFWDVEIYVHPFLVYTYPEVARRLLRFRHSMLEAARRQARIMGERGALFPWRTINGDEASGYYPASTAQYHINADIAYALRHYVELSGDREAVAEFGADILVETARLWSSLGFHEPGSEAFHIHGATGPDEYSAVVDDSTYTNLMARENLSFAADAIRELRDRDRRRFDQVAERTGLEESEPAAWRRAAERMFVPFDPQLGVHPQDVGFLQQEAWDFAGTPPDHYPLLLHYHPLVLHRHQVVKQADVVLAMFLLGDRFTAEQRHSNFHYYEPITTADSSLSHAIQSIEAAGVGRDDLALEHFGHALFMDLTNWAGNAEDGVHVASAGGVWLAAVYGFAGLRDHRGRLTFDPRLPQRWERLAFTLRVQDRVLDVDLTRDAIAFRLASGEGLGITVRGEQFAVRPAGPTTVPL